MIFLKNLLALGMLALLFAGCKEEEKKVDIVSDIPEEKIFGIPGECMNKINSKDSIGYYECCERLNACWIPSSDEEELKKEPFYLHDTVKILQPEDLQRNLERTMEMLRERNQKNEH